MLFGFTSRLLPFVGSAFVLLISGSALSPIGTAVLPPDKMDTVLYGRRLLFPNTCPMSGWRRTSNSCSRRASTWFALGESSWGLWEPQDGRFEYAWMDRVVERMQKAGIKVIMGTPNLLRPSLDV